MAVCGGNQGEANFLLDYKKTTSLQRSATIQRESNGYSGKNAKVDMMKILRIITSNDSLTNTDIRKQQASTEDKIT